VERQPDHRSSGDQPNHAMVYRTRKRLVEDGFEAAHAKTIVLVQDNLSIHSKTSLYEAFPAVEARRLVERFESHYTPKHGAGSIWPSPNSAS
jgi:hypothetical protein